MAEPAPKEAPIKSRRPAGLGLESTRPGEALSNSSSLFGPTGFGPVEAAAQGQRGAGSAFDVCHVGVVLRALLFVHVTLAMGVSFAAVDFRSWLTLVAVAASVALPSVLLWLVVACLLKRNLARLPAPAQWVAAVGLGALSGGFGWGLQVAGGLGLLGGGMPWVAPVLAGAGLAAALFYWLTRAFSR